MIAHICIIQYNADKLDAEEALNTSPHRSLSAAHQGSVQVSVTTSDNSTSLHHFIAQHHIQTLAKPSLNNNQIKESVN